MDGKRLVFGVSGALYQSSAVLFDRQTESLWAQPIRKSIAGKLTGSKLKAIPHTRARWSVWLKEHPETLVLSTETGHQRSYEYNPYEDYQRSREVMFPVNREKSDCKIAAKALVLGVEVDGLFRAYPLRQLKKARQLEDRLGSHNLEIRYDAKSKSASALLEDGSMANGFVLFWFAWQAFHPDTDCWVRH